MFATTASLVKQQLLTLIIACFFQPALGRFDLVRCCVVAARDEKIMKPLELRPWHICHFGDEPQYPSEERWPSVAKTRTWCKAECSGYQQSETEQWLQPLATWIAPYIAIMLLCPIGEWDEEEDPDNIDGLLDRLLAPIKATWKFIRTVIAEYILLLGDPASALWGAFSEIISDLKLARRLNNKETPSRLSRIALWITMLAGDTKLDTDKFLDGFIAEFRQEEALLSQPGSSKSRSIIADRTAKLPTSTEKSPSIADGNNPILRSKSRMESSATGLPPNSASVAQSLQDSVLVLVRSRVSFSKSIFLPVILTIAVVASVFFDSYRKLGDKDTAHALAYGIWYSWIITLGVAANCFATSTNVGLARLAFSRSFELSHRRVSLAQRYINRFEWNRWLWPIEHADHTKSSTTSASSQKQNDLESPATTTSPPKQNGLFWFQFLIGQLAGWACVAFACSCAAVVSWTTPTVGLGCRSFNFVLYGVGTFFVALLHVICAREECLPTTKNHGLLRMVLLCIYWVVVVFNAAVLVIGTILHLSGAYRSCWCSNIFTRDDTLLEFQRNTELAYNNAKRYWLVTGYVAFSFVWVVGSVTVAARKFIVWKIEQALDDDEGESLL